MQQNDRTLVNGQACAVAGTLRVRAHADVDAHIGLTHLRAVRRAADAWAGVVDVQIVAFPQSGVCGPQVGQCDYRVFEP